MPKTKKYKFEIKLDRRSIGNVIVREEKAASIARSLGMPWPTAHSTSSQHPLSFELKKIR